MSLNKQIGTRELAAVLIDLPGAHAEASARLSEVIAAVRDTGKPGALTLTLKISLGKLNESMIEVVPLVGAKVPRRALPGEYFFPTDAGDLSKNDPNRLDFFGESIRPEFVADIVTDPIKEAPIE